MIVKEKIYKDDLEDYFNLEAEATRQDYDAMMRQPLKERIRRRKAVEGLYWDSRYAYRSEEGHILYRLKVERNLSDFKEGEYLVLHKADRKYGQKCQLYAYDEEDNIIIDIYPRDCVMDETWKGIPLVLDRNVVDLRDSVYNRFTSTLKTSREDWDGLTVNTIRPPRFGNMEEISRELEDTERNFEFRFTERQREAVLRSMATDSYYLIQGPPGTGKSFVLGVIILEELLYFKRKVAVIGPNHMAINNALMQVLKMYPEYSPRIIKVGQLYNARHLTVEQEGKEYGICKVTRLDAGACNAEEEALLYGLTPHALYTSRARDLEFDTLVIDEAGQETIPLALMAMKHAGRVILAGDHRQLPPIISSDKVPDKLKESIFQRLMTPENCTMLDISFRMCGPICDFVSGLFYAGRLKALHEGKGSLVRSGGELYSFDHPVVLCHVDDCGEQVSDKEALTVVDIVARYCGELGLPPKEIAVLSPFRGQVSLIRRTLRRCTRLTVEDRKAVVVDTIDRMQGQEREVVILSLAAGDIRYMREMGEFLYSPNKLNVAFSRARSKLIVVGNLEAMSGLDAVEYPHIRAMLRSAEASVVRMEGRED